ncbi:MAG: endo-1,4-beta-xylanase [candidate division KSB1 bacterium]|nr:endo-1,4-beta-xylanase [candidate division KSB1 bacterium]
MYHGCNRLAIALIFSILIFISGPVSAQLVTNGGFENSDVGGMTETGTPGWLMIFGDDITPPVFEIVNEPVAEGNHALKTTVNGLGSNQWDIQVVADSIPVTQGATYNYSVWAKAEKAGAQVNFTVGNYSYSEYNVIRPATLTTQWKKFTMQFTVSDNQTYIRAPIHFSYAANAGNAIYLDNLQITDVNFGKTPVVVEAESGIIGSSFSVQQSDTITYVTTTSDYLGQTSPEDTSSMITYQVTFEDSGHYNLFARLRVGPNEWDDDSFFAAHGFGDKNDTARADWVFLNGLADVGFAHATDIVNGPGVAGSEIWKWVNLTKNFFPGELPQETFYVSSGSLLKTFQIGSREDGLWFDKFAFGRSDLYYTVEYLDEGLPGSVTPPEQDSSKFYRGPPLAEGASKFLGNVKGLGNNNFADYWNQLTPGNEGKWGSVATSSDTNNWNWSGLDDLYDYAKSNDLIFKDHCLIWGNQQPNWIESLDPDQQLIYIKAWFRMVGERYPDMDMVDVVNEPLHDPPSGESNGNYLAALGGKGETGWDWVIKAFELARTYLPNAQLLINDYHIINNHSATTSYLEIINLLRDRGLIDGIGVQGHRFELEYASTTTLKHNLDRLAATGLPIYISELDLGNLNDAGTPDDDQQLTLYKRIFPVLWEHPSVKGITLWGYIENQMWQPTCYLVHYDGAWRPAMEWLAQYIQDYVSGVEKYEKTIIPVFKLKQNYPNPFNPNTTIEFSIPEPAKTCLVVYDVLGRKVATLVNKDLTAGVYTITWNVDQGQAASGTYFCRLVSGDQVRTQKMLYIK